ncbi:hypothetical protein LX16_0790 [Stackebrandtia albiflava]|uniref:TIGR01777 family protein n=1 Tax=Stackebrandtia albiflava TaxID=406432 RepID=A0A562VB41_9ACTN|nr:TIGR01777 family oxidoreductase [Stackebrandtia albiflava]TWJ15092.1 hypothetical protein LX16_0790 [Stackebrandtia albiflava]
MKIVIAGGSGLLGRHLIRRLRNRGHHVVQLVRRPSDSPDDREWDPYGGESTAPLLRGADAVVNLGGAGIADRRWNPAYKELITRSRVVPTRALAEGVAETGVPLLVNASAVGWYGDTRDRLADETDPAADDYLGRNCREWEAATTPAAKAGARVITLRTGHVLSADSEMIKRLVPVFRYGLGGRFGSGRQYFPWISLLDWIQAVQFLIDSEVTGPANLVGPTPATNADLTRAMADAMRRPAPWTVPPFALKLVIGEAAVELLRGGKIDPAVLNDAGFRFRHRTVEEAVNWAVGSR